MPGLFGLDIIGVSALLTLAAAGGNSTVQVCARSPAPPVVSVQVIEQEVHTEAGRSSEELASLQSDTDRLFLSEDFLHGDNVSGLTSGHVSVSHNISFRRLEDPRSGFGCLWFDRVNITLRLDPAIYIASEIREDACKFREVFNHEMLHVAVDRQVIGKYKKRMKDGLDMLFSESVDYASGVIPAANIEQTQERMKGVMQNAVGVLFTDLQRARAEAQSRVDSPYEYTRISRACR